MRIDFLALPASSQAKGAFAIAPNLAVRAWAETLSTAQLGMCDRTAEDAVHYVGIGLTADPATTPALEALLPKGRAPRGRERIRAGLRLAHERCSGEADVGLSVAVLRALPDGLGLARTGSGIPVWRVRNRSLVWLTSLPCGPGENPAPFALEEQLFEAQAGDWFGLGFVDGVERLESTSGELFAFALARYALTPMGHLFPPLAGKVR